MRDLNPRPAVYKTAALTTELIRLNPNQIVKKHLPLRTFCGSVGHEPVFSFLGFTSCLNEHESYYKTENKFQKFPTIFHF